MSVQGIHWAQDMRGVCPYKKALLYALGERHHKDQNIVVADQVMLAADAGMTDRTVRKYLRELEADGLVSRRVVGRAGGGRVTHYILALNRRAPQAAGPKRKDVPDPDAERVSGPIRKDVPHRSAPRNGTPVPDQCGTLLPFPKDTKIHEEDKKDGLTASFDSLWASWPAKGRERSKAKAKVLEQFRISARNTAAADIVASAAAWLRGKDPQFTPALDRWLRDGKYEHNLPSNTAAAAARTEGDWPANLRAWLDTGAWRPAWGPTPDKRGYRGPLGPLADLIEGRDPAHPVIAGILENLKLEAMEG